MRYNRVGLDPQDKNARKIIDSQKGFAGLADGYLALQGEGQSIEFKDIRLQELKP